MDLGHSNEANIRQRRGDIVIAIKKFAYTGASSARFIPIRSAPDSTNVWNSMFAARAIGGRYPRLYISVA